MGQWGAYTIISHDTYLTSHKNLKNSWFLISYVKDSMMIKSSRILYHYHRTRGYYHIYILYSMIHLILSCIMDYISRILYHEIHLISHISPEDFLIFRVRQLGGWKPGVEGLWRPFLHAPRAPCGKYRHEAVGHGRWIGYTWCIAWKIVVYPGYSTWCIMDSTNFGYKSMYSMETSHLWMLFSHLEVICSIDPVLYIDISLNFW